MKPLLVGEANPYQRNPRMAMRYALHPDPPQASGGRLCHFVMGLDEETYLAAYDRTDLCFPKWSWPMARRRASELMAERGPADVIVVCGAKVAQAFGLPSWPFRVYQNEAQGMLGDPLGEHELGPPSNAPIRVVLPHPSGLCRVWHEPDAVLRARAVLRQVGVLAPEPPQVIAVNGHDSRCEPDAHARDGYFCVVQCPVVGRGLRGVPRQYRDR